MKKFLLASTILTTAIVGAQAADLPVKASPMMVPAGPVLYTWTGFYIGGHIGGAFRDSNTAFGFVDDRARFFGGGQVGADYQFSGSWLIGLEAQYSAIAQSNSAFFNERGLASVTGRLGYVWGPGVLYAKGGYAYADRRNTFPIVSNRRDGYTIGGGLEYMFAQNWSAKLEYQYFRFDDVSFVAVPPVAAGSFRDDLHTIKLGVNYHFNFSNPLSARY